MTISALPIMPPLLPSALQQVARLAGDLRQHGGRERRGALRAADHGAELVDLDGVARGPFLDSRERVLLAALALRQPAQELEAHLLEVARDPGDEQALPRVRRDHDRGLLLSPVEPEPLAEVAERMSQPDRRNTRVAGQPGEPDRAVD